MLSGRLAPTAGGVDFEGRPVAGLGRRQRADVRRQVVGLDADVEPDLDPKRTATAIVAIALAGSARSVGPEQLQRARQLLAELGVPVERFETPAADLDDAEARLVAAARTVANAPRVVIYRPWPTDVGSGLDRDPVLAALRRLRVESATALVVVSELLPLDLSPGDRALVVCGGRLVEVLPAADMRHPLHPYTLTLLAPDAAEPAYDDGAVPAARAAALDVLHDAGCPFRSGCPRAKAPCARMPHLERPLGATHDVACHFPEDPRGPTTPRASGTGARVAAATAEEPGEGDEPTAREFAQG